MLVDVEPKCRWADGAHVRAFPPGGSGSSGLGSAGTRAEALAGKEAGLFCQSRGLLGAFG